MRQINRIISTYTADVSGVCSAMYELGGMTVMHDPSGCNSTYNTHDEPRWFDMPSLIYISALTEMDAVLGSDDKFIDDVCRAAGELSPRFITICGSVVPMMSGFDFPAVARVIEKRTGIPTMGLDTNGTGSYIAGAGAAMTAFAKRFVQHRQVKDKKGVNILGVTPLDFSVNSTLSSLKQKLTDNGWNILSCWTMTSSFEELILSAGAQVNLVVSSVGLECARFMYREFSIPYVVGLPVEPFDKTVLEDLQRAAVTGENIYSCTKRPSVDKAQCLVIGESVASGSIACAVQEKYGVSAGVLCPVGAHRQLLGANDRVAVYEDEITSCLAGSGAIIADPMFKPVVPEGIKFYSLPHEACSGRLYRRQIPDLIKLLGQTGY